MTSNGAGHRMTIGGCLLRLQESGASEQDPLWMPRAREGEIASLPTTHFDWGVNGYPR